MDANTGSERLRDTTVFHRLLVITLQICTILLSVDKTEEEDYKLKKVGRGRNLVVVLYCGRLLIFCFP